MLPRNYRRESKTSNRAFAIDFSSNSTDGHHSTSTLQSIHNDLDEIKEQKKWLLIFFRQLNKGKVDKCVGRVDAALEQFNVYMIPFLIWRSH